MATIIKSNGSGAVRPLECLFTRLATETLDPTFEKYGDFASPAEYRIVELINEQIDAGNEHEDWKSVRPLYLVEPGQHLQIQAMHFFGNFFAYSHVFSVYTDDAVVIERLITEIKENKATLEYKRARAERAEQALYWARRDREQRQSLRNRR